MSESAPTTASGSGLWTLGMFLLGGVCTLIGVGVLVSVLLAAAIEIEESDHYDVADAADAAAGSLAEALIEEGFGASPLDPDEPLLAQRKILITEAINERIARHVVERLLHLNAVDPGKPIDLLISTNGGWKDSAFAIIDTMRSIDAPVNTIALGGCYSAGSMLLVAGTGTRSATPSTIISIHVYPPDADPEEHAYDPLEQRRFANLYLERSKTPAELFDVEEESQPYFTAEEALEMGLIDEVRAAKAQ